MSALKNFCGPVVLEATAAVSRLVVGAGSAISAYMILYARDDDIVVKGRVGKLQRP